MDWLVPLRRIETTRFELDPPNPMAGAYGGFLMASAVRAASMTVEGAGLHSLHTAFLRRPQPGAMTIDVEPVRDGRSFATRRLQVTQGDDTILLATLSYNVGGSGADWQSEPDAVDPLDPETLTRYETAFADYDPVDLRPERAGVRRDWSSLPQPIHPYWSRATEPIGTDPAAHVALVAYTSDYFVILHALAPGESMGPHAFPVTLEHSLWIHRPLDAAGWLRYDATPLSIAGGRALVRGEVHDGDGRLVASFVQECLIRSMPAGMRA